MEIITDANELSDSPIAATIGMFDGVHLGHRVLLDALTTEARRRGLKSGVITFKEHPQIVLNPQSDLKMILTLDERLKRLEQAGVDYVLLMNFSLSLAVLDSFEFMKLLRERYHVRLLEVGYNHSFGHDVNATFKEYETNGETLGMEVVKAPEYDGPHCPVSSSVIRKLLATGKVDDAMNCLGSPFSLSGTVTHGHKNGRTLGFPTANVKVNDDTLIVPHRGAYAVKITLSDGSRYGGMANIGVRPTLDNGDTTTFEVNIFDFDGDLYGQQITVEFIRFIRTEHRMDTLEALAQQLKADEKLSRTILSKFK